MFWFMNVKTHLLSPKYFICLFVFLFRLHFQKPKSYWTNVIQWQCQQDKHIIINHITFVSIHFLWGPASSMWNIPDALWVAAPYITVSFMVHHFLSCSLILHVRPLRLWWGMGEHHRLWWDGVITCHKFNCLFLLNNVYYFTT